MSGVMSERMGCLTNAVVSSPNVASAPIQSMHHIQYSTRKILTALYEHGL